MLRCCAVTVVSSVIVVSAVTPPVLLAIFALALIYRQIQKRYVATSRELKRCASDGPPCRLMPPRARLLLHMLALPIWACRPV